MLREFLKSEWWQAGVWLIWASIGGLFPVWAGLAVLQLMGKSPTFRDFSSNGQFALYAASFITTASYIVLKEYRTPMVFLRRLFGAFCIICVIAITLLFVVTTGGEAQLISIPAEKLQQSRSWSFVLYAASAILAYLLTALDKQRTVKDLRAAELSNIRKLEQEVKAIGE